MIVRGEKKKTITTSGEVHNRLILQRFIINKDVLDGYAV